MPRENKSLIPRGNGEAAPASGHRNNAAEWLLWLLLIPAVPVVWIVGKIRRGKGEPDTRKES